ncbi:MAG: dihydrofolate reductase [Puniceicoccales bacterium]|jgi:dihydrofolate reductase|nr:dihydrofolate reductase [Puniceicoccales bacterium]
MTTDKTVSISIWLKAIAAIDSNRVIGANGGIPWKIKEEFGVFKKITTGHSLVMGRKTYESIGKPLPNRINLIMSRSMQPQDGITIVRGPEELRPPADGKLLWVCGGAEIYRMLLPRCSQLILSHVHGDFHGDTFFPEFSHLFKYNSDIHLGDKFVTKLYDNVHCSWPTEKFLLD